jgi:hypothetical protein
MQDVRYMMCGTFPYNLTAYAGSISPLHWTVMIRGIGLSGLHARISGTTLPATSVRRKS